MMHSSKAPFDEPDTPAPNQASGEGSSSATGIFGTVSPPPARTEEDLLASLAREQQAPAAPNPPSVQPATSAAPSSPGEFTRMLQALTTPAQTAPSSAPTAANPSVELARVFSHVSIEKKPPAEPAKPASPGSFTQIFSAMSEASTTEPAAPSAAPPAAQPPASSPASGPGEFTKMFQGMQGQGSVSEQRASAAPPQPPRNAEPGEFTRMFSSQSPAAAPPDDPLKSLRPGPAPEADLKFWKDSPRPVEPSLPAQGGFTQLLQALSQEPAVKAPEPPVYAPPAAAPRPAPAVGGFTQLLQALSAEPPAQAADPSPYTPPPAPVAAPSMAPSPMAAPPVTPPMMPPSPVVPPVSAGPGEFTRVISGSALRDVQSQPGAPSAPLPAAPAAQPAWSPAHLPPPPAMHLPQPAPPLAPQAFAFPPTPAPPAPAAPVPATGALQKYMPLILVLNIFLMLAIVLILIFVFHHK